MPVPVPVHDASAQDARAPVARAQAARAQVARAQVARAQVASDQVANGAARLRADAAAAADLAALAIRAALDRLSGALARAAAAFARLDAWNVFGFARLEDCARERYDRSGRWLRDLAALGERLTASPGLAKALTGADGGRPLGRVAAILVARAVAHDVARPVAHDPLAGDPILGSPDADAAIPLEHWIAVARSLSVRDLRAAIREARAGPRVLAGDDDAGTAVPASSAASADSRHAADSADDDPDADRVVVRLPMPLPVIAAFDEAHDLHGAVEGRSSSVAAFVEALVGEARSGSPEESAWFVAPLARGISEVRVEAALRRGTDAWATLPEPFAAELDDANDSLARFAALEAAAGRGDVVELDRQLRALIQMENELEAGLGRLLAAMAERRDWTRLQFAGIGHYAEERLGMSRSRAGERARLARVLRPHPAIAAACVEGRISMAAASLIHRILGDEPPDREVERAWVEHAATTTIKRMRDEVRALGRYRVRASAPPDSPPRPLADEAWSASLRREPGTALRRVLDFGLRAAGIVRGAGICRAAGFERSAGFATGSADEPDVFHSRPPTSAAPDVFHPAHSAPDVFHRHLPISAPPDVFQRHLPESDACLRLRLPPDLAADFLAAIEAARDAAEARAASVPWDAEWPPPGDPGRSTPSRGEALAPGETAPVGDARAPGEAAPVGEATAEPPSAWAARIAFVAGRRIPLWVGLLAVLEDFALTWDNDAGAPERRDDRIFIRDGWRCAAPGCSSRRNLEIHHVVYRSRGGSDDGWNLVTLCRFHHQRGEHGGLLSVRGVAPTGLTWRLGRADLAADYRAERRCAISPAP